MLDRQTLLTLSQFRQSDRPVVSLYLKIDRTSSEPKHVVRLKNLIAQAESQRSRYKHAWEAVQRDLDRVSAYVRDAYAQGAQHLAVFACGDELFEAFSLPYELPNALYLEPTPILRPLFRQLQRYERFAAALVTQRLARLFLVTPDAVEEVTAFEDEIPPRHDQGGWAQARLQRHHDEAVYNHLKRVAEALFDLFQRQGFSGLVVFGTEEITSALQDVLHPYVRDRVIAAVPMDITATTKDVGQTTLSLARQKRRQRQKELLDLFEGEVHRNSGRAVGGLKGVISAVQEGRVQVLLLQEKREVPGGRCKQCGALTVATSGTCDYCGGQVESLPDVIEPLVAQAFQQGADVLFISGQSEQARLEPFEGVGAISRYALA